MSSFRDLASHVPFCHATSRDTGWVEGGGGAQRFTCREEGQRLAVETRVAGSTDRDRPPDDHHVLHGRAQPRHQERPQDRGGSGRHARGSWRADKRGGGAGEPVCSRPPGKARSVGAPASAGVRAVCRINCCTASCARSGPGERSASISSAVVGRAPSEVAREPRFPMRMAARVRCRRASSSSRTTSTFRASSRATTRTFNTTALVLATVSVGATSLSWGVTPTSEAAAPLPVTRLAYGKATAKWTAEIRGRPSVRMVCSTWTPRPATLGCTFYDPARTGRIIVEEERRHVYGRVVLQRWGRCELLARSYGPTFAVVGERRLDLCRAGWWRRLPAAPR